MPEDRSLPVQGALADEGHQARQAFRCVDRVDEDPLRSRNHARGCHRLRGRNAVAIAKLAPVDHDVRRGRPHVRNRGDREQRRDEPTDLGLELRVGVDGDSVTSVAAASGSRASDAPTINPACVPPVAVGTTIASGRNPAAAAWSSTSSAARTCPRRPPARSHPPAGHECAGPTARHPTPHGRRAPRVLFDRRSRPHALLYRARASARRSRCPGSAGR